MKTPSKVCTAGGIDRPKSGKFPPKLQVKEFTKTPAKAKSERKKYVK
jgi:hypothetical protein